MVKDKYDLLLAGIGSLVIIALVILAVCLGWISGWVVSGLIFPQATTWQRICFVLMWFATCASFRQRSK